MEVIDIVLIVLLALGAVKGYNKGLIVEVFSLVAFFLGLFIAIEFTTPLSLRFFGDNPMFHVISVAVFLFSQLGIDELTVLCIVLIMWILNFVLPSIVGSYYLMKLKAYKSANFIAIFSCAGVSFSLCPAWLYLSCLPLFSITRARRLAMQAE